MASVWIEIVSKMWYNMLMIMDVFKSASKIVLLVFALTACIGFLTMKLEAKDFMLALTGVFSFYFGQKNQPVEVAAASK